VFDLFIKPLPMPTGILILYPRHVNTFRRCELDAVSRTYPPIDTLVARVRRQATKREEGCGLSEPVIV